MITKKACENDLIIAAQPYSHQPVCHHSVKQWNWSCSYADKDQRKLFCTFPFTFAGECHERE